MFRMATRGWEEEVVKPPKPAFHAAPASRLPLTLPPPPLPPFIAPKPQSHAATPPPPPGPAKPGYNIKAIAQKVYDAMGPGTAVLTYRQIAQRGRLSMDDVILGLEELNRTGKVVQIRGSGDINQQRAFRTK